MIYMDNSATTRPYPEVLDTFYHTSEKYFANPSSLHSLGGEAERLLEASRQRILTLLKAVEGGVIFTSGGTESNNLAIKGTAFQHMSRGQHLITSKVEHPSVLEAFEALEDAGFSVTYLDVDRYGYVRPEDVQASLRKDTILVSLMSVNNELGTVQPIKEIGDILTTYPKVYFHVDHVQGQGKIDLSLKEAAVDLCSVSGHKIHGVKGTGLLYKKAHVRLFPLVHGGGQEEGLRSGTQNLPGVVAMTKALRMTEEKKKEQRHQLQKWRDELYRFLENEEGIIVNSPEQGVFHILNFSMPGYKPEVVIHALAEKGIYISTKSACSSKSKDRSAVLEACGAEDERATSALRISFSYFTSENEIERFRQELKEVKKSLVKTSEV